MRKENVKCKQSEVNTLAANEVQGSLELHCDSQTEPKLQSLQLSDSKKIENFWLTFFILFITSMYSVPKGWNVHHTWKTKSLQTGGSDSKKNKQYPTNEKHTIWKES